MTQINQNNDIFRITLLGTGTPSPQISRAGAATLIEAGNQKLIFDFGRNSTTRLWQLGIPLGSIDAHFLTHFHSDYTIGFPDLWLTGRLKTNYGKREKPMNLYGPKGIIDFAKGLENAYATDIAIREQDEGTPSTGVKIELHEISTGLIYDNQNVKIYAFNNNHGEYIKPSYGYCIQYNDSTIVLSGDTRYSPEVVKNAKNADLLVHCVSITFDELLATNPGYQAIAAHLSSPEDVAQVLNESKPTFAVFNHVGLNRNVTVQDIAERVSCKYDGNFMVGEDLMVIDITTNKSKRKKIFIYRVADK